MTIRTGILFAFLATFLAGLAVLSNETAPTKDWNLKRLDIVFVRSFSIPDADPTVRSNRTFKVPTHLVVERTKDRISISIDTNYLEQVELDVGHNMVCGFTHVIYLKAAGEKKVKSGFSKSAFGTGLFGWTYFINRKLGGIPIAGESYVVEVHVVLYETDSSSSMWPGGGKYRELWSRTLKSGRI